MSVAVRDLEQATAFYGETLGIRRNELAHESYPEFETGNLTITLHQSEDVQPGSSAIGLRVSDVEEARRSLEAAGVEFERETFDTGVCHVAFFRDPDGNGLMLHRRYAPFADGSRP